MTKFHINKLGLPELCKAGSRNCSLGGDESHFNSMNEAVEHASKVSEGLHELLPEGSTKDIRNIIINKWKDKFPEEAEQFVETGIVKGFDDEIVNNHAFADGVRNSLENNFKGVPYKNQRDYINKRTKDLARILRGGLRKNEKNFINKNQYDRVNERANKYYKDVMSKNEIIDEVLNNQHSPKELLDGNPDDYEIHVIPITSACLERLNELTWLMVRKDDQAILRGPVVNSQGIFIDTYNNRPVRGSGYSMDYSYHNSPIIIRLTTDMKQWRIDSLDTKNYPNNKQIVDKYGPAMGRYSLPLSQVILRICMTNDN